MNISHLLLKAARGFPQRPALFLGEHPLATYSELGERAGRLAAWIVRCGLKPGDRAAMIMSNVPEYLEVLYGAWIAGLAVAPINSKLHPREFAAILDDLSPQLLFVSEDLEGSLAPISRDRQLRISVVVAGHAAALDEEPLRDPLGRDGEDLAWIFYTSGTTGLPKGAMLSHRNLWAMTLAFFSDVEPLRSEDAMIYAAPMSHAAGLWGLAQMLAAGPHVFPQSRGFVLNELFELGARFQSICLFAVPTMVNRLVAHVRDEGADPRCLRTILYAGGPMYVEDIFKAIDLLGDRFVQIYGQGESPMTITVLPRQLLSAFHKEQNRHGAASVGRAHSIIELRVADENGRDAATGQKGEVLVRGETVMKGYWRNPAATAETLRDGWLHTGDVGSLDSRGFLTLTDRIKDVVISGGSNIYPREIEEVLLRYPGVREVAIIGRPHREWGEEVVAIVVADPDQPPSSAVLDRFCLEHIASYKRPREYLFVDALPKSSYGKVSKAELRALALSDVQGSIHVHPAEKAADPAAGSGGAIR